MLPVLIAGLIIIIAVLVVMFNNVFKEAPQLPPGSIQLIALVLIATLAGAIDALFKSYHSWS